MLSKVHANFKICGAVAVGRRSYGKAQNILRSEKYIANLGILRVGRCPAFVYLRSKAQPRSALFPAKTTIIAQNIRDKFV